MSVPPAGLGFEIRYHEATRQHWLYVHAGYDSHDGQPLVMATPASPYYVSLWELGEYATLADILRGQGCPVGARKPSKWKRWLRSLQKMVGRGS